MNSHLASATETGGVSYADPRASDLIIHHMPGHFIRRLQQVAVKLFFERVGLDMTPVQFAALAAVAQRPRIDQARLSALIGCHPAIRRDRPARSEGLARAVARARTGVSGWCASRLQAARLARAARRQVGSGTLLECSTPPSASASSACA
jgi:hypothetical protein